MASMFRKAMNFLGLDEEEDYDHDPAERAVTTRTAPSEPEGATVRPITPRTTTSRDQGRDRTVDVDEPTVTVRPRTPAPDRSSGGSSIRTVPAGPASRSPHPIEPTSFEGAKDVADRFKEGTPVIVNLQHADRDLARRLIDFASGLCYGLGGKMARVADGVYLLTPAGAEVSEEDRRRMSGA